MRFHLTTEQGFVEVLGELVDLPNAGDEQFFVHHAVVRSEKDHDLLLDEELPLFAVSHVGTGFRVAAADTIDEAIAHARFVMGGKTPQETARAIAAAKARISEWSAESHGSHSQAGAAVAS